MKSATPRALARALKALRACVLKSGDGETIAKKPR
jgi:hypothetical protein